MLEVPDSVPLCIKFSQNVVKKLGQIIHYLLKIRKISAKNWANNSSSWPKWQPVSAFLSFYLRPICLKICKTLTWPLALIFAKSNLYKKLVLGRDLILLLILWGCSKSNHALSIIAHTHKTFTGDHFHPNDIKYTWNTPGTIWGCLVPLWRLIWVHYLT